MPKAMVNDVEIYYETRGEGSPLTLINGWGGSMDSWSPRMLDKLATRHLVITMDNRGTGRKAVPKILGFLRRVDEG